MKTTEQFIPVVVVFVLVTGLLVQANIKDVFYVDNFMGNKKWN